MIGNMMLFILASIVLAFAAMRMAMAIRVLLRLVFYQPVDKIFEV